MNTIVWHALQKKFLSHLTCESLSRSYSLYLFISWYCTWCMCDVVCILYHLTRTLPARFPLCGPVVRVSPPIRHPWVNTQVCREIKIPCKRFLKVVLGQQSWLIVSHQHLLHWNLLPELSLSPSKPWHTLFYCLWHRRLVKSIWYSLVPGTVYAWGQGKPILCSLLMKDK